MPWTPMDEYALKLEFVCLALKKQISFAELCRRFVISRQAGYELMSRYEKEGEAGLVPRSRRPKHSPRLLTGSVEEMIVALRKQNPRWGGRKIRKLLDREGVNPLPAASTITRVIKRHGLLIEDLSERRAWVRFEHPVPNALWQMDFKGWINTLERRCHPLTVLDDRTRYCIVLAALPDEGGEGVKKELERAFSRYGLPDQILMDNGTPWSSMHSETRDTYLTVWLMRLGIKVIRARPDHPQTKGKDERFHRTLKEELLDTRQWRSISHCQEQFDRWRHTYNTVRPHDSLDLETPASIYRPSLRRHPGRLDPASYADGVLVRKVTANGRITLDYKSYFLGHAYAGEKVGLVEAARPGSFNVYFLKNKISTINT